MSSNALGCGPTLAADASVSALCSVHGRSIHHRPGIAVHSSIHPFIAAHHRPCIHRCPVIHSSIHHSPSQPMHHSRFIHSSIHHSRFIHSSIHHSPSQPIHCPITALTITVTPLSSWSISLYGGYIAERAGKCNFLASRTLYISLQLSCQRESIVSGRGPFRSAPWMHRRVGPSECTCSPGPSKVPGHPQCLAIHSAIQSACRRLPPFSVRRPRADGNIGTQPDST